MRRFTILMLLSLTLAACESGPETVTSPLTVTPTSTQARSNDDCVRMSISLWGTDGWITVSTARCESEIQPPTPTHVFLYGYESAGVTDEGESILGKRVLLGVDNHLIQVGSAKWAIHFSTVYTGYLATDRYGYQIALFVVQFADGHRTEYGPTCIDCNDVNVPDPDDFPTRTRGRGHTKH